MARQLWSSRLTYILTVAGATVGFGATWRFPYLVGQNGGGAYVLTFVIAMFLVGIPIILVENVIGRRSHSNIIDAFAKAVRGTGTKVGEFWKIFGYTAALGAFGILSYYMVLGGWVIAYAVEIVKGAAGLGGIDLSAPVTKQATEEIFRNSIENSPLFITVCTVIFIAVNWAILKGGIIKGIERSVRGLMPLLFICLTLMVVRSLTLDNALEGVKFYLSPDFSKITPRLFLDVLGQVFFALSLGFGVMITLSSYLSNHENLVKTAVITGIINTLIAVFSGLMIFPSLSSAGLDPDTGPSLVFMSLPVAFSRMPAGWLFSLIFFLLLAVAALTTSLTIYQVLITALTEKFKCSLNRALNYSMLFIFLFGNLPCILSSGTLSDIKIAGYGIFDCYDFVSGNICFVVTALGCTVFVGWVMKREACFELDNNFCGKSSPLSLLWYDYVKYVVPLIIAAIFVYGLL